MIVIAKLYQLGQKSGKYTKEFKTLERDNHPVEEKYLEQVNENWMDSGRIYEVDEKATKQWKADFEAKQERREQAKELKNAASADVLGSVLKAATETKKGRPKKETETEKE